MKKLLLLAAILPIAVVAAEPSVYGAGNLDSENPYGLTSSEKKIVKNSKDIKSLKKEFATLKISINDILEKFDGLRSVTESISNKIGKIDRKIYALEEKDSNLFSSIDELKNSVSSLRSYVDESRELQNSNQERVKNVLNELSSLIDSINSTYVSKSELEDFKESINSKIEQLRQKEKTRSISSKSGAQLLKEASEYFRKKEYNEARIRYEKLVSIRYKPARSNFMLGEIAYRQKFYKKAIEYYKKSIALYDKASYIPTLLYHTGVSLSKLKKNREASKFFQVLKSNYPESKEAKSLKK